MQKFPNQNPESRRHLHHRLAFPTLVLNRRCRRRNVRRWPIRNRHRHRLAIRSVPHRCHRRWF